MKRNGMHIGRWGIKRWFKDGQYHREDGPAVIFPDDTKFWWLNDKLYSFDEWLEALDASDGDKLFLKLKWV